MALLASAPAAFGQLAAGDLQFIGYTTKFNKPAQFAFVLWSNVPAGTTIYFTDSGFLLDDTLNHTEDVVSWTAPTGGALGGSVWVWDEFGGGSTGFSGTLTSFGLADSNTQANDQLFASTVSYVDGMDASSLIQGLQISSTGWDTTTGSIDDFTSDLPDSISGDVANFVGEPHSGNYVGPRTGLSLSGFQAAIDDPANWNFSNGANIYDLTSVGFDVGFAVPEPSTVLPLATMLSVAVLGGRRRPRRR